MPFSYLRGSRLVTVVTAALAGTALTLQGQRPVLASMLEQGMQLVYSSDGQSSPPWTIDSIVRDVSIGDHAGCIRIRLRLNPAQPTADTRIHCVDSLTMLNWDTRAGAIRPARPLGANAQLDIRQANGGRNQFATTQPTVERIRVERGPAIDTVSLDVIPTTVTTFDSTGKAVRRLRERFSVALATATGGVFEVADSTVPGGWRTTQVFNLALIRLP
jgi:hypothetical protein